MTKEEIEIFEDIADSLRTIAAALAYNPNTEVMSATESLSLIEKHLSDLSDLTMELEDIKEIMSEDGKNRSEGD